MARGRTPPRFQPRSFNDRPRQRSRERRDSRPQPLAPENRPLEPRRDESSPQPQKELFPNRRPVEERRSRLDSATTRDKDEDNWGRTGHPRRENAGDEDHVVPGRVNQNSHTRSIFDEPPRQKHRSRSPSSHQHKKRRRSRSRDNGVQDHDRPREHVEKDASNDGKHRTGSDHKRRRDSSSKSRLERTERHQVGQREESSKHRGRPKSPPYDTPIRSDRHGKRENKAEEEDHNKDVAVDESSKKDRKRRRDSRRSRSPREKSSHGSHKHQEHLPTKRSRSPSDRKETDIEPHRASHERQSTTHRKPSPSRQPSPSSHEQRRGEPSQQHDHRKGRAFSPRPGPHFGKGPERGYGPEYERHHSPPRRHQSPPGDYPKGFPPSRSHSPTYYPPAGYPDRRKGESPYNNGYGGRPPPLGPRHPAHSPPHRQYPPSGYHDDWPERGRWDDYGPRGSPSGYYQNDRRSPPPRRGSYDHDPYLDSHSYGPGPSHPDYVPPHLRGPLPKSKSPRSVAYAHFQNKSWTPQTGSRGGVAPSERLPYNESEKTPLDNNDATKRKDSDAGVKNDENHDTSNDSTKQADQHTASDPKEPDTPKAATNMPPPTAKPGSIKFEMKSKLQPPPSVLTRPNPIQTAAKPPVPRPMPPREPRGFAAEEELRRADYPPPRPTPPRFNDQRRDDWERPRIPPAFERRDNFERPRPPLSPARDRRSSDLRDRPLPLASRPDPRGPRLQQQPAAPKAPRPRKRKLIKITRKHRRVVLPSRKLPEEFAKSKFVYYPKPDGQSVVGAGTYGKVFKARNVYLNKLVALKTLPLVKHRRKFGSSEYTSKDKKRKKQERWIKEGLHLTSLREIKLLKSISHQHENVVGIREIFLESQSCNLVFDYFEFDMHGIIYSASVDLEDGMMKDLVRQVFQGLDFLHTKASILHRDIKAANILVGTNGQVKITDFGLAKHVKDPVELEAERWYRKKFENSNRVITTPYRPPELLLGATLYGGEVDVWSAGCVLFEAFLKRLPFQGTGEDVDHLLTIWKIIGEPNTVTYPDVVNLEWYWLFATRIKPKKSIFARMYRDKVSPQLYHLLRCIFQHDPTKRPTAAQVLTHPFFSTEAPLPISASSVLETVEGEWHELEYKMVRDKEKAEARRKHEDSVILGFLEQRQRDHKVKLADAILDSDIDLEKERIAFYATEQKEYLLRIEARPKQNDTDSDHVSLVAEMKKTHGELYMDTARRGRYRGPAREKMDERLLQEAWKWYEDERKKGNDPVPAAPFASRVRKAFKAPPAVLDIPASEAPVAQASSSSAGTRPERKAEYAKKKEEYDKALAIYTSGKEKRLGMQSGSIEKRVARSPLVDEPEAKKLKDDGDL